MTGGVVEFTRVTRFRLFLFSATATECRTGTVSQPRHVRDRRGEGVELRSACRRQTGVGRRWALAVAVLASACGDSGKVEIESAHMYRGYDDYEIHLHLAACVFSPSADVRETTQRVEISVERGTEEAAPCQRALNVRLREPFDKERQVIDATSGRSVEMRFLIEG